MSQRFDKPFFLGFEPLERAIATTLKSGADNYPPYDVIERRGGALCLAIAVAGFERDDLTVTVEGDQLVIAGRRQEQGSEDEVQYLHKGISTRQFKRRFLLGAGMDVETADLSNGLLTIELRQRTIEPRAVAVTITTV